MTVAGMGGLWLVGSSKLYVSFAEYRLFYRALLQMKPIILRSLLIVATPYEHEHYRVCLEDDNNTHKRTHTYHHTQ